MAKTINVAGAMQRNRQDDVCQMLQVMHQNPGRTFFLKTEYPPAYYREQLFKSLNDGRTVNQHRHRSTGQTEGL